MRQVWSRVAAFWSRVETKVKFATLGAFLMSLAAALVNALLNGAVIPSTPHGWAQFVTITLGPPVLAAIMGWSARHTPRPVTSAVAPAPPTRMATTDDLLHGGTT